MGLDSNQGSFADYHIVCSWEIDYEELVVDHESFWGHVEGYGETVTTHRLHQVT